MSSMEDSIIRERVNSMIAETLSSCFNSVDRVLMTNHIKSLVDDPLWDVSSINTFHSFNRITSIDNLIARLAKINEKQTKQKQNGVFYTPNDAARFLICNAFLNYICRDINEIYSVNKSISFIISQSIDIISKLLFASVFDPTCGASEFLLVVAEQKIKILELTNSNIQDSDILDIARTIFGNDLSVVSTVISKIRLFFYLSKYLNCDSSLSSLVKILNSNFKNLDFVILNNGIKKRYAIIVGNPPYVEYKDLPYKPNTGFGNAYADVVNNANSVLDSKGVMAFVLPVSFVSTKRMYLIRKKLTQDFRKLYTLNFADRPDCLFPGVHQKLSLIIGCKGKEHCSILSSKYYHWNQNEREQLFENCEVVQNNLAHNDFIPKLGNKIECDIFEKITNCCATSFKDFIDCSEETKIYLNMRACFWMKAFSFNPGSSEYKAFPVSPIHKNYLICLLNSNLFYFFWTVISDCWHITNKELVFFKVPLNDINFDKFNKLAIRLEHRLEKTKKYIGSKQTAYEYKHKECKSIIDEIDDEIKNIYNLNGSELDYIKAYNLKYRMSTL